ncbi:MAG TPA: inorganic phosphate transporter [Candidatus Cloacimonadota bacterium]|nr:inorganic phosphate transporter [Candidatus Cloacimonadota bacterium]HQL15455.1 inorganic phosphate transporter [Candidatus Cloacimonadota bacterium]
MGYLFLTSGLFLGWALGANHHGNVFGPAVQTKMIKFKYAAMISSIFVILGSLAEGSGGSATLNRLGAVNASAGAFTVALATALAIALMTKIKLPVSTSQAIVGAIIGWNIFAGMMIDYHSLVNIVSSWVIAPVLSAAIAFGLYHLFKHILNHSHVHLLHLDAWNRWGLVIIGAFGAYSLGANNIANVVGIFISSSPFKDIYLTPAFRITGLQQLYFWGAASIALGMCTYSKKVMETVGNDLLKLSPITGLIVVMSSSLVLYLFGSHELQQLLINLHLPTIPLVPLSSSQATIGAVIGVGLTKGGRNIHFNTMGKISLGWVTAPTLACILTFFLLFFVQNVFEQPVVNPTAYQFYKDEMLELQKRGIDLDALAEVNGRHYENARELNAALNKIEKLNRKQKLIICTVTQVNPLKVDYNLLNKQLEPNFLTPEQWKTLRNLDGHTYLHNWQLEKDLQNLSPEWHFKPETNQNQIYNNDLQNKLKAIYNICQISPSQETEG